LTVGRQNTIHEGEGLTGSEIAYFLKTCEIADVDAAMTKRHRLYNAFAEYQNKRQNRTRILGFIRRAMKSARFSRDSERFEPMRANLNRALAFAGLAVDSTGALESVEKASSLPEAQRRARELRADLSTRCVHPDVLRFCREELLADNYFHAVMEAVKSVADKLRSRSGLMDDGAVLVDRTLAGDLPLLGINALKTESQEQSGLGLEGQRASVEAWLNGGDWQLVEEVVEIESGKSHRNRPGLTKALEACGRYGAKLIISRLDRLSRDPVFL
jgi:hypothetical protein